VQPRELLNIRSEPVPVPDKERLVHLQFRRFAGCPVCNLHLRSFAQRYSEITGASIREVVVFHSTRKDLERHASELPFDVIADPDKRLYAEFGVEAGLRALLDPRAWLPILKAVTRSVFAIVLNNEPITPWNPTGGRYGLPADFLIGSNGAVLACKYGAHVYDQWSVDEVLILSTTARCRSAEVIASELRATS
jgi:hypothetical protein